MSVYAHSNRRQILYKSGDGHFFEIRSRLRDMSQSLKWLEILIIFST